MKFSELINELAGLIKTMTRPNPRQTWGELIRDLVNHYELWGVCFIWRVPASGDRTAESYAIDPRLAYPQPPDKDHPEGWWRISSGGIPGRGVVVPAEQMMTAKGPVPPREIGQKFPVWE